MPAPRSLPNYRYAHPGIGTTDGRTASVTLAPGLLSLEVRDLARVDAALERERSRDLVKSELLAGAGRRMVTPVVGRLDRWTPPAPSRVIHEWSRKSRTRMLRAFGSVDFAPLEVPGMPLAMVTLTYPGRWLDVAPSGKAVKRHLRLFQLRYKRAVGIPLHGAWKMEFQDRGAPHFHLMMPVPAMVKGQTFEHWLAWTWAGIVGAQHCGCHLEVTGKGGCCERARHLHAGTGVDFATTGRVTDPKRLGIYFLKHSSKTVDGKEYQHIVPREWLCDDEGEADGSKGPGRFWGFWGLKPASTSVEVDLEDFHAARRVLRKVARASARRVDYARARANGASVRAALALPRRKVNAFASSRMVGGFVIVNDGPRLGADLARYLNARRMGLL